MSTTPAAQPPVPPPPPLPGYGTMPPPWWAQPPQKRSLGGRVLAILGGLIFAASLMLNLILLVALAATMGEPDANLSANVLSEGEKNETVAVYAVEGTIGEQAVTDFRKFAQALLQSSHVKAVVIRVNSPGGTVAASDEIYHMIQQIRETGRPVLVSMGGVAASGGYYISSAAQAIYAEPTTITGSIGVISVWPVLKGFLDNHGVEVVTIRSRQSLGFKATENFWETPDARIRQDMQEMLSKMHIKFEQVVRGGRPHLKTQEIKVTLGSGATAQVVTETEPLNGKVYLAQEAVDWGLADKIGYLADATKEAAQLASLEHPRVVQYSKPRGLRSLLAGSDAEDSLMSAKMVDKLMSPQVMMLWKAE